MIDRGYRSCEECPAGWEDRSHEGECYDCGCIIYGEADGCRLTRAEITKRLRQWEEYQEGKIDRPQWVANKFMRQMDRRIFSCPAYPPKRMSNGCHESIYSADQMRWDMQVTKSAIIHEVLEIIDKHAGHGGSDDYCDGYDVACLDIKKAVLALKGEQE